MSDRETVRGPWYITSGSPKFKPPFLASTFIYPAIMNIRRPICEQRDDESDRPVWWWPSVLDWPYHLYCSLHSAHPSLNQHHTFPRCSSCRQRPSTWASSPTAGRWSHLLGRGRGPPWRSPCPPCRPVMSTTTGRAGPATSTDIQCRWRPHRWQTINQSIMLSNVANSNKQLV